MYINDVNIIYYTLIAMLGSAIGQIINYCNFIFLKQEKIFSKKNFKEYKHTVNSGYIVILTTIATYIALLYLEAQIYLNFQCICSWFLCLFRHL